MNLLPSFPLPVHALVVGASGGVGGALMRCLLDAPDVERVTAWSRTALCAQHPKLSVRSLDIVDERQISAAASAIVQPLHLIIVATGLLHDGEIQPEKTWRALNAEALQRTFAVNTIGPALVAKHTLPLMPRHGRAVFAALSAKVGSIGDNNLGGWYGYRAAKAALNQILRTLSIELATRRPDAICVGLHPGTVDTALSQPFQSDATRDRMFSPEVSARHLLSVIDRLSPADSGSVRSWDGSVIPP
jgi:NAD(P)-dependent dehydrogenase (short-subunit alcohol dehydrogenase family)